MQCQAPRCPIEPGVALTSRQNSRQSASIPSARRGILSGDMGFHVLLALRPAEVAGVELAAMNRHTPRAASLLFPPDAADGPPQLELDLPDDVGGQDAAREIATATWAEL